MEQDVKKITLEGSAYWAAKGVELTKEDERILKDLLVMRKRIDGESYKEHRDYGTLHRHLFAFLSFIPFTLWGLFALSVMHRIYLRYSFEQGSLEPFLPHALGALAILTTGRVSELLKKRNDMKAHIFSRGTWRIHNSLIAIAILATWTAVHYLDVTLTPFGL